MRIESVKAYAFGPFVDETLDLAPGMTVIHGPNESGKSNWHAALYAGLCGVRRGRGRGTRDDQDFKDRHRPWVGDAWEVSAIVQLSDDRRVELHHDLDGKVDCWAQDVELGRDYSNEVIHNGAPDGARWLGLDRRSFLSTACVRQSDIQSVIGQAGALQNELQRAAATAGTDSTAAAALERLEDFRRENVGQDRANSTKPLRTAKKRHGKAQQELNRANEAHAKYLGQLEEIERLREVKDGAERSLQLVEAARAADNADRREKNARRARRLSEQYPEEPRTRSESSEAVGAVNAALALWDERPDVVELQGQTAEDLRSELDRLPSMPNGDTSPHESVVDAREGYSFARSTLERHREGRPPDPPVIETGGLDASQLRNLAGELALKKPAIDPQVEARVAKAHEKRAASVINGALVRWDERPASVDLKGQTADDLRSELDCLPSVPTGDTNPHESVVHAKEGYSFARSTLDRHREVSPPDPPEIEAGGLDAAQLRELAGELALMDPVFDTKIEERVARARERVEGLSGAAAAQSPQESKRIPLIMRPVVFLIRMTMAPFRAFLAAIRRSADQATQIKMLEERQRAEAERRDAEAQLGNAKYRLEEVRQRRSDAKERAARRRLSAEPEELERLAQQVEQVDRASRDLEQWEAREEEYVQSLGEAESLLCKALRERGVADVSSPTDALALYEAGCSERDRVAREASRRPDLERAYKERQHAESLAEDSARLQREAAEGLRAASEAVGVTGDANGEIASRLRIWMNTWESNLSRDERDEIPGLFKDAAGGRIEKEIRDAEVQLGNAKYRLEDVRRRRKGAEQRALRHGVPKAPGGVEQLAQQVEQADQASRDLKRWRSQEKRHKQELGKAKSLLCEALKGRGVMDASSPDAALDQYEEECSKRDRMAKEASRRPDLKQAYEERQRTESLAEDSTRLRREAAEGLRAAAEVVGATGDTDDEIADRLIDWRHDYQEDLKGIDRALGEWNELQSLVDGSTFQELEQAATQRRRQAEQLAIGLESGEMDGVRLEDDVEVQLRGLRQAVSDSREALAEKEGSVEQYSRTMLSVPESEEELESAIAELRRVEMLDRTLESTRTFLERAQDKVHRTVAPLLRDAIRPWLHEVTDGRYTDIRIDAESLLVRVSGDGRSWRDATRLSHGTAEQVYLLLRIAMARLLTREGETCPLILDDVTVNCDPQRQAEVMNILHKISREQQVIVFSQEPETLQWAQECLLEPDDRLVELPLSEIQA